MGMGICPVGILISVTFQVCQSPRLQLWDVGELSSLIIQNQKYQMRNKIAIDRVL